MRGPLSRRLSLAKSLATVCASRQASALSTSVAPDWPAGLSHRGDPPSEPQAASEAGGEAAQDAVRWEDYTQTAVDPSDDCTIWYVGDYLREGSDTYGTKIGAFRLPGCRK